MDKSKLLKSFGANYNKMDFAAMESLFHKNVSYEAFDCMYNVTTIDGVQRVLANSDKEGTSAYEGFYMKKGMLMEKLTECIIICNDDSRKSLRIVDIKSKRGKILKITGFDPKDYTHTRGKKIES